MNNRNISTFGLDIKPSLKQRILNSLNISIMQINFVNGNNSLYVIFVDDVYHFLSLLLHTFSCRNYEHNEVSNPGSSSSHVAEGFVSGCVNEGYFLILAVHMEGPYLLGDSSHLPVGYIWLSEVVDESGFSVVDMPHNSYNWWFFAHPNSHFLMADRQFPAVDDTQHSDLFRGDEASFAVAELFLDGLLIDI